MDKRSNNCIYVNISTLKVVIKSFQVLINAFVYTVYMENHRIYINQKIKRIKSLKNFK